MRDLRLVDRRAGFAPHWPSRGVPGGRQSTVQIEGGTDEGQVRERLREVAQVLRLKAELLTVQPQVIRVAEHLLEEEPCLLQVAHPGEALDIAEGTHRKRSFLSREPVGESAGEAIAIHQGVTHELTLDRAKCRNPPRVRRGHEAYKGHEERRSVQGRSAGMLDECAT